MVRKISDSLVGGYKAATNMIQIKKREWMALAKSKVSKKPISEEEYTTNKVLTVFSVCLAGVLVLMVLQRLLNYVSTWKIGRTLALVLLGVGVAGVVWSLYLLAQERSGKRTTERKILRGRNVLITSLILAVCMWVIYEYGAFPIKGMYVILPVLAVYYLIYHSYSPEFFIISLDCGIAVGLMWVVQRALNSSRLGKLAYVSVGLAVVLALIQVIFVKSLQGKKGKFTFRGKNMHMNFSKNAYTILLITPVLMAVMTAGVLVWPARFLVLLGAAAAYLFVTAVYYTVKLM